MTDPSNQKEPVLLVVDDEPHILKVLSTGLSMRGFQVRTALSGEEALKEIRRESPDAIILDLMLPGMSGLEVCRRLREFSTVPIIVLSARGAERDKVMALDQGADDYVTKPFGIEELLARVRAVLRRLSVTNLDATSWTVGDVTLNLDTRRVAVAGNEIKLTPKEFEVLKYLVRNAGKVVTHRAIILAVWGWESADQVEYLRGIIKQLRSKMEPLPHDPKYILTEPWVGYRLSLGMKS
jgi:two-component system, OmpR family, KDP operon response regulator KdpE